MANNVTLATIRARARQLADMENSTFWTDANLLEEINGSARRLYNKLVQVDEEYFASDVDISSVADQIKYSITTAASDFFKILWVSIAQGSSPPDEDFSPMERWNPRERGVLRQRSYLSSHRYRYRLVGDNLEVRPAPPAGYTFRVYYVPTMTALSADGDTLDMIHGFDEWVALDVAEKMLLKEQNDVSDMVRRKMEVWEEVLNVMSPRDRGEPPQVQDVESARILENFPFMRGT